MSVLNVNLTRIESINMKKSLNTAKRGHKLLKDKLDELIKKLLELVEQNQVLRKDTDKLLEEAYQNFMLAKAVMGEAAITEAFIIPKTSASVELGETSVMSVKIPEFKLSKNTNNSDKILYGFAYTTSELDLATEKFSEAANALVQLAENEKAIELISNEIEKTRRRVNAIENVTIPNYIDTIKYIGMKLSEDERASTSRLMKVKDMILENKKA
ncbi:MAG: V-type ATP synthase subunit D [Clostridia bacterium]|nr:V-type ATP synthase subunit D [Clostridia bacterium]